MRSNDWICKQEATYEQPKVYEESEETLEDFEDDV